jgi:SAM-dependent methyltransferase
MSEVARPLSFLSRFRSRFLFPACLAAAFAAPAGVLAQAASDPSAQPKQEYTPVSGQAGKDVVWVPTPMETVGLMLDIARLTPKDYVVDLGSGDGRNVILAAKRGARGLGVEYNPDLVELSKRNAQKEGVAHLADFVQGDMFEADFSKATVLALFLLPDNLTKLEAKFLKLTPGTRIVANTFGISGWTPDREENLGAECKAWCKVLLYTVPAPVAGDWRVGNDRYQISQNAQIITGSQIKGRTSVPLQGRVDGNQIYFRIAGVNYSGVVKGDRIEGSSEVKGKRMPWNATKG